MRCRISPTTGSPTAPAYDERSRRRELDRSVAAGECGSAVGGRGCRKLDGTDSGRKAVVAADGLVVGNGGPVPYRGGEPSM